MVEVKYTRKGCQKVASMRILMVLMLATLASVIYNIYGIQSASATDSTISLSVSDSTVNLDIASRTEAGNFAKSSGNTIAVSTSNATGYTLGIAASSATNYNKLINSSDSDTSTNHLDSITASTTEAEFKALAGKEYNGMWGYLPSKYIVYEDGEAVAVDNTTSNPSFLPAPSTSGDLLDITSSANSTANEYSLAIGARVDSSTKVGAYSNAFVILVTANAIPYTITYNDNTITNMPTDVNSTSESETVKISSNTPKKSGYTFVGWCTVSPTKSGLTDTCTGTTYAVGSNYAIDKTSTANNLQLFAMWKRNTMQNVSEWQASIGIGEETTAVDTRDGKVYSIARLCMSTTYNTCPTSKLWMTQNLDLLVGPAGSQTLSSVDSDINSNLGSGQGYSTSGSNIIWTPDTTTMKQPAVITNHANGNPASSVTGWTNDNSKPYQAEGGDYYVYTNGKGTNETHIDTIYNSLTACIAGGHTEDECRHYHVGNYYNWSAAVAVNASSSYTSDLYVMPNSICPKGWRLPNGLTGTTGNETISEFNQLGLANGITSGTTTTHNTGSGTWVNTGWVTENSIYTGLIKLRSISTNAAGYQAPLFFVRSGYLYGTVLYYYGTNGYLWSSTSQSQSIAYFLAFDSTGFYPANQYVRYDGFPVRCVAR